MTKSIIALAAVTAAVAVPTNAGAQAGSRTLALDRGQTHCGDARTSAPRRKPRRPQRLPRRAAATTPERSAGHVTLDVPLSRHDPARLRLRRQSGSTAEFASRLPAGSATPARRTTGRSPAAPARTRARAAPSTCGRSATPAPPPTITLLP